MRAIASVSIDQSYLDSLRVSIQERWFKSLSEYFIYASKIEQQMMSEQEVLVQVNEARSDYYTWKTYSWLDLLKKIASWK